MPCIMLCKGGLTLLGSVRSRCGILYLKREKIMSYEYIQSDPAVMLGKPVIKGTRITVECVLEKLSMGHSVDDVLKAYPHLTREAVMASLAFAADSLHADVCYPV